MTIPRRWKKARASGQEEDCVEVAEGSLDAIQDSKRPGEILTVDVRPLLAAIRRGHFD